MPNSTRYSDEEIEKMSHKIYGHAEYDRIRFAEGMRVLRNLFLTDLEQAQKKIEELEKAKFKLKEAEESEDYYRRDAANRASMVIHAERDCKMWADKFQKYHDAHSDLKLEYLQQQSRIKELEAERDELKREIEYGDDTKAQNDLTDIICNRILDYDGSGIFGGEIVQKVADLVLRGKQLQEGDSRANKTVALFHIKRTDTKTGNATFLSGRQRRWLFIERLDAKFGKWQKEEAENIIAKRKEIAIGAYEFEIVPAQPTSYTPNTKNQ